MSVFDASNVSEAAVALAEGQRVRMVRKDAAPPQDEVFVPAEARAIERLNTGMGLRAKREKFRELTDVPTGEERLPGVAIRLSRARHRLLREVKAAQALASSDGNIPCSDRFAVIPEELTVKVGSLEVRLSPRGEDGFIKLDGNVVNGVQSLKLELPGVGRPARVEMVIRPMGPTKEAT